MSVRMMALVWELDLPDSEKLVLLALADCANDEGHCWPGMTTLKKKCSKSDRTVQLSIKMLCTKGHLTRREVPGKGCNYTVHPIVRFASYPRSDDTPEATTPPKRTTQTPEAASGKPLRTTISSEAKASSGRAKFTAPQDVSDEQWSAFRSQRKKALNQRSYVLLCNKLTTLAEAGWPPGDMIDLAIERGWETVFEPRTSNGQSASNVTSLRGARPDPALDLLRAARAAEDREDRWRTGPSLPAVGTSGP